MDVLHTIAEVRARLRQETNVGLVPTMGNLHAGHLALVQACRQCSAITVASIFVNPLQFAPNEDFGSYPRTLPEDRRLLEAEGVDVIFAPNVAEMYPTGRQAHTTISVPALANTLCGASRPGHFDGMATVVAKLLNIVRPQRAFFGEKDWQQLAIVRAMVRQLDMAVEIVGVPTVRSPAGLALSSRNGYLTDDEIERAPLLNRCLREVADAIASGNRDCTALETAAAERLAGAGFVVDYVAVRDAARLVAPDGETRRLRVLGAVRLGGARLIDNVGVGG